MEEGVGEERGDGRVELPTETGPAWHLVHNPGRGNTGNCLFLRAE